MSNGYYYEGVDPTALLDTIKSTYGYNESEEDTIRDSEGYSVNSYEPDDLDETHSDSGSDSSPELHENAYSQTAVPTSDAPLDERLLTGRYSTGHDSTRVQEPLAEKDKPGSKDELSVLFDWNDKFQTAVESLEGPEKYRLLSSTARDFVFVATTYGRIIISEAPLPVEQKTIKPSSLGGIAGGQKYLVKGILFKFAVDVGNIYGGDENAQKAASSELKGLSSCYMAGVDGIHFPLMALIHYMGYCLIALSTLPLGPNTLKYGSADAGRHVHDDDPILSTLMKTLGMKLNLKGHWAGVPSHASQKKFLHMPCDIEGHKGKDGKFYMVDFSRLFPPEAILPGAPPQQGALFFRHLRPELVINNERPLSSDAFCGFGLVDPDRKEHNAEVLECTKKLLESVIPNFADKIKTFDLKSLPKLTALLHSEGINVRHLGFLRAKVGDHPLSRPVLIEMIARVFKNKLKTKWRKIVAQNLYITEDKCINATIDLLNLLICSKIDAEKRTKYEKFWNSKLKVLLNKKFRFSLSEDESKEDFNLLSLLEQKESFTMLLDRTLSISGITLTPSAKSNWQEACLYEFQFLSCDIAMLNPIVKHIPIIEQADISILFSRGLEAEGQEAERLLSVAIAKITQNYGTFLFPHEQLRLFGNLIAKKYQEVTNYLDHEYLRQFGTTCFTTALQLKPNNMPIIKDYANFLTIAGRPGEAFKELLKAATLDPFDYELKNQTLRVYSEVPQVSSSNVAGIASNIARDSLNLNPKQGEPYYWWAHAILRTMAIWKSPISAAGHEVENGAWALDMVEELAEKIKSGLELDPEKLSILDKFFPNPRPAFIYALSKVPELATKIDKVVKQLHFPNFLQNEFFEQFPVFTNLEVLTIPVPEALDSGIIRLIQGSSPTLTKVNLSSTKITTATLEALKKCVNLEWLALDNCQFAENPFETLLALIKETKVTQLFIKNVPHLTEQQISELISVRPMTRLGFRKTDLLSVELFKVLQDTPSLAESLIRLDLENFDQLTVDHVLALLKTFKAIKAISFLDGSPIEALFAPVSLTLKHPTLEEFILPAGYPLLFSASRKVIFSTVVARPNQLSVDPETAINIVENKDMYQEYNSLKWVVKRASFTNKMFDLKHDQKNAFYVEKMPPGDRLRIFMTSKNGNIGIGDLATLNTHNLMLNLFSFRANLHTNGNNGFHVQISQDLVLNFSPNDARILIGPGQNATFYILAAFVLASKLKRTL